MSCKGCFVIALILASISLFCGMKKGQELKHKNKESIVHIKELDKKLSIALSYYIVDIDAMIQIESSGNPKDKSEKGARGLAQIMKPTWDECVKRLGKDWNYETDCEDSFKSMVVGKYYVNTRIPQMIKYYKLPDSDLMRLACYNWGIGNMKKLYKKHKDSWRDNLPRETFNHLIRYEKQINRKSDYIEEK